MRWSDNPEISMNDERSLQHKMKSTMFIIKNLISISYNAAQS